MVPDWDDTIVALSSASGPGDRAIVRLSGPTALRAALAAFVPPEPIDPRTRRRHEGELRIRGVAATLPADLYLLPGPHSYTGQDVVELHTISAPPLIDQLIADLLHAGARAARAGEFTLRAFLAGKLDLPQVEAVLGVIEAEDDAQLRESLAQLAGGMTRPLDGLRDDLLNLLADLEAGLDFVEEDLSFVTREDLLLRLTRALAQVTLVRKQLEERGRGDRPFRAVLVGRANAGKSSLFNALTGSPGARGALVSPIPGTTRDYLLARIEERGMVVELVDTAGWQDALGEVDARSQALGRDAGLQAQLWIVCIPADAPLSDEERAILASPSRPAWAVATQCDRHPAPSDRLATSAVSGEGLAALKARIVEQARIRGQSPLAPSLSRCKHHVDACCEHLRRAHHGVLFDDPPEIQALELRAALEDLGAMVGAVYTDDLLDRIFSRFCIGK